MIQALEMLAWFAVLIELILACYFLFRGLRHPLRWHAGILVSLLALNGLAYTILMTVPSMSTTDLATWLVSSLTLAIYVWMLLAAVCVVKPEWAQEKWYRPGGWLLGALGVLPVVLLAIDLAFGTQLWFTGLPIGTRVDGYERARVPANISL